MEYSSADLLGSVLALLRGVRHGLVAPALAKALRMLISTLRVLLEF